MEQAQILALADALFRAERARIPIRPLTESHPEMSLDDAYAIQMENVRRVTGLGHVISGKKIGLTSEGIQRQLGVSEPDYGHLFQAMDCADGLVRMDALIQPKIEAELAFVLAEDLTGGNVTREEVRAKTAYVVGAFEIVDSRVADWRIKLPDTVADNASSGRYVLGKEKLSVSGVDLAGVRMKLFKNDELVGEGEGAAVLGDPCLSVAWLANRLWGYGVALRSGEVVLSGAFSAAPMAARGDRFRAEFTRLGEVTAAFV